MREQYCARQHQGGIGKALTTHLNVQALRLRHARADQSHQCVQVQQSAALVHHDIDAPIYKPADQAG